MFFRIKNSSKADNYVTNNIYDNVGFSIGLLYTLNINREGNLLIRLKCSREKNIVRLLLLVKISHLVAHRTGNSLSKRDKTSFVSVQGKKENSS